MPATSPVQSASLKTLPPGYRPTPDSGSPLAPVRPYAEPPPPALGHDALPTRPGPASEPPRSLLLRVLQDRAGLIDAALTGGDLPLRKVLLGALVACAVFGFALGVNSAYLQQPFVAMLKLPAVMLGTLGVCFPAFYVLGALRGSTLRVREALSLIGVGMGLRAALLLSLVPILLFFAAVGSPYWFLLALGIGVAAVAEVGFLHTLEQGLHRLRVLRGDPISIALFRGWALVYLVVGAQFTWSMRPIIGQPGLDWTLFGGPGGNMLTYALQHVFGG